jgi:hypothetical protein
MWNSQAVDEIVAFLVGNLGLASHGLDVRKPVVNSMGFLVILFPTQPLFTSRVFEGIISYPGISPIGCLLGQV